VARVIADDFTGRQPKPADLSELTADELGALSFAGDEDARTELRHRVIATLNNSR